MALQKSFTQTNGAVGNYWKITAINVMATNMTIGWTLSLFASKALSDSAPDAILGVQKYFTSQVTRDQKKGDLVALGYIVIAAAQDPDLDGAVNV